MAGIGNISLPLHIASTHGDVCNTLFTRQPVCGYAGAAKLSGY